MKPVFTGAGVAIITPDVRGREASTLTSWAALSRIRSPATDAIIICGTTGESVLP